MSGKAVFVLILLIPRPARAQATASAKLAGPIATTVCKILEDPASFNNKLVQVQGYLSISFEYSILHSESCSGGIWFALADDSGPSGLRMIVPGHAVAGKQDSDGHREPPIPVKLIRDANFEKFDNYLRQSTVGAPWDPCGPGCHRYRITATFTGRIDSVSDEIHEAHLKKSPAEPSHGKGYGQMGIFDAQLVVQSMRGVEAVDSLDSPCGGFGEHRVIRGCPGFKLSDEFLFAAVPHGNGNVALQAFAPGPFVPQ